jgi:hypothetical protein
MKTETEEPILYIFDHICTVFQGFPQVLTIFHRRPIVGHLLCPADPALNN